jgi:hypothetical protein
VAAYGAGFVRAVAFSYTPALYIAGGACLVAALAILTLRRTPAPAVAMAKAA